MVSRTYIEGLVVLCVLLVGSLAAPVYQPTDDSTDQLLANGQDADVEDFSQTEKELESLASKVFEKPVAENAIMPEEQQDNAVSENDFPRGDIENENSYQLSEGGLSEDADLTPKAVAEYLLITDDFNGFEAALQDLTQSAILTPEEVRRYRDDVNWEYENLVSQMMNEEAAYLQEINEPIESYFRKSRGMPQVAPARSILPENLMESSSVDIGNELRKMQEAVVVERQETVDQLLQSIIDPYYWRNKEGLSSQEISAVVENLLNQPVDDTDMEKVIDLIQEVMNEEPATEVSQDGAQEIQQAADPTEAELEQLPKEEDIQAEGSGDLEDELPKVENISKIQVEPASS